MIISDISIELLKNTYTEKGDAGVEELLGKKINNKPAVTSHKPTLNKIINWLKNN